VRNVIVRVSGCDDYTQVVIRADEAEIKLLQRVAELITRTSTYGCMPKMSVISAPAEVAEVKGDEEGGK